MGENERDSYRLVHYTSTAEIVASILTTGFLLVPNKRHLINRFLGQDVFAEREPQEFGMVSFSQLPIEDATPHRDQFGRFGIIVSWEWALGQNAQRVIYVDESGPMFETFAWLFRLAKQELDRVSGGAPSRMTLENKAFAFASPSTLYARLLTLYEYMEPARNSGQVEWRIVNTVPHYQALGSRADMVKELLSIAQTWGNLGSIKVEPNDVLGFVCPRSELRHLRELLPERFCDLPIVTYPDSKILSRRQRSRQRELTQQVLRERVVYVEKAPPTDTIYVKKSNWNGAYRLPQVARVWGSRLYQDELVSGIHTIIQYEGITGELFEVTLPIFDALYLMNLLRAMQERSGLDARNPVDF